MSYRTTIALIIILALVIGIGFVYTNNRSSDTPDTVTLPREWFYQVDDDAIDKVVVNFQGQGIAYVTDSSGKWHFETPNGELVDVGRWGGVTLLLSGPQYRRIIAETATDLGRYGLQDPALVITAGLENLGDVVIRVGDRTPDGISHYAQYIPPSALADAGRPPGGIYLVDSTWGDQFSRLVTEPPRIIPTPEGATPEPTADPNFGIGS
jgi:hypothetical protein